jgi:hypothetical protein
MGRVVARSVYFLFKCSVVLVCIVVLTLHICSKIGKIKCLKKCPIRPTIENDLLAQGNAGFRPSLNRPQSWDGGHNPSHCYVNFPRLWLLLHKNAIHKYSMFSR